MANVQPIGFILGRRFKVTAQLAKGGMGVLFRAQDINTGLEVAAKVLAMPAAANTPTKRWELEEKFAREGSYQLRWRHLTTVVTCFELGRAEVPGFGLVPWIAMELLDGSTLRALILERQRRRLRPWSPGEALALLEPVIEDLARMHAEGYVHRDIKPENLFVEVTSNGGARLRLLDFGAMKVVVSPDSPAALGQVRVSPSELLPVTPAYAGPEQFTSRNAITATDVFALACVFTEMLTLQPPHVGKPSMAVPAVIRPTPQMRGIDVGRWEAVLQAALLDDPGARIQNAGALLEALRSALPQPPAPARRAPWASRGAWFTAGVAVMAAALGVIVREMPAPRQRPTPRAIPPVSAPPSPSPQPRSSEALVRLGRDVEARLRRGVYPATVTR